MTCSEILSLIEDYKNIVFTEDNIYKYTDFACFFCYDNIKEYMNYIIENYIIKHK